MYYFFQDKVCFVTALTPETETTSWLKVRPLFPASDFSQSSFQHWFSLWVKSDSQIAHTKTLWNCWTDTDPVFTIRKWLSVKNGPLGLLGPSFQSLLPDKNEIKFDFLSTQPCSRSDYSWPPGSMHIQTVLCQKGTTTHKASVNMSSPRTNGVIVWEQIFMFFGNTG